MKLNITTKRIDTDSRNYADELIGYCNANWGYAENFIGRFEVLSLRFAMENLISIDLDNLADGSIIIDATAPDCTGHLSQITFSR